MPLNEESVSISFTLHPSSATHIRVISSKLIAGVNTSYDDDEAPSQILVI